MVTSAFSANADERFEGIARVVAFGDVHGDYDQFIRLLKHAELIDEKLDWTGGESHFVQLGDILDRGPDSRKIADLIMQLERQAERSDGRVHFVIGNHEAMNMTGDFRYVHPGEYAAFTDKNSKRNQDRAWRFHLSAVKKSTPKENWDTFDEAYKAIWLKDHPLGWAELRSAWSPEGAYGAWLLDHHAVIKINSMLFVHGGIGPDFVDATADWLNEGIAAELATGVYNPEGLAFDDHGPLWYRGLAWNEEAIEAAHVDALLQTHGVEHIVIGHTPITGAILPRFGQKVVLIDVGLGNHYGSREAYLEVREGKLASIHRGTRLELPSGGRDELLTYLRAAAALDPAPSPIEKKIRAIIIDSE